MKVLFQNCKLIDKYSKHNGSIVDILVDGELIVKISENIEVDSTYILNDMNNTYVSAGWIDIHTHCFDITTDISIDADKIGVDTGVVCIIDAGSSGAGNVDEFYASICDKKTIVKAWLNIASTGLTDRHELKNLDNIDVEKTIAKAQEYEDFVVGIKVRASASVMSEDLHTPFVKAREVATEIGKPIMVHIGNYPPTIDDVLSELKENDIITHCYHGKPNGVIHDNEIRETVIAKRLAGLCYDVGHGQESFCYEVAKKAIALGFKPDTISSDLHKYSYEKPVHSLSNVMTKMLSLTSLEEVIYYVTGGAAKVANLTGFGHLSVGEKANITFFNVEHKEILLVDSMNETINITEVIQPRACVVNGKYWEVTKW